MSNDPSMSIEDKNVSAVLNLRFTGPVPEAPLTSIEDLIGAFVEGTADFQVANEKDPYALLVRGLVEATRLIRSALKASTTRGDVHWPQNPEVLARTWKESLGLHDWAGAIAAALKRLLNAVKANAATPEIIDASEVREANKAMSRLALDPPARAATLMAVIAPGCRRTTTEQILDKCPSLRRADATARQISPACQSVP